MISTSYPYQIFIHINIFFKENNSIKRPIFYGEITPKPVLTTRGLCFALNARSMTKIFKKMNILMILKQSLETTMKVTYGMEVRKSLIWVLICSHNICRTKHQIQLGASGTLCIHIIFFIIYIKISKWFDPIQFSARSLYLN